MKYLEIVKKIQKMKENEDYLVLVRNGIFFYAIGKDAVILTEIMGINNICMMEGLCKCVIPVSKIEKFCYKLKQKRISYVVYDYEKQMDFNPNKQIIERFIASPIYENRNCLICENCNYYEKYKQNQIIQKNNFQRMLNKMKERRKNGRE